MNRLVVFLLACAGLFALTTNCDNRQSDKEQSKSEQRVEKISLYWELIGQPPEEKHLNPYELTRDDQALDVASIVYAIRRDFKTTEQIAGETGFAPENIEHKMKQLKACDLVRQTPDGYLVNFPFWDIPLREQLNELGFELAYRVVHIVRHELIGLKLIFEKSTLVEQGFSWDEVVVAIVGGLLLDAGVNDRGLRQSEVFVPTRDTPLRPGGYRYWYRAIEGGWGDYWEAEHQMIVNEDQDLGLGIFSGGKGGRQADRSLCWDVFDTNIQPIIFPLIKNGKLTIDELQEKSGIAADSLPMILQRMAETKIIRLKDDSVYPGFPVFNEPDTLGILLIIDRACRRIINNVYLPSLPAIEERWEEIAPENWEIENVDKFFVREVYDRVYNLALDILIEESPLPVPAQEPPFDYWGFNVYLEVR